MELRRLYRDFKPDIIHLHSSKAAVLGRLVFPKRKIVYTVHGFDSIRIAHRVFLPVEKILQYFCSAIVGVSRYDYENLLECGITKNVSYVYNGIAVPDITNLQPLTMIDGSKKTVLTIARVASPKRHDLFIEISRLLPEYNFVWLGNLTPITEKMPDNCHFIGNIPNAGKYCALADLFLLPSNYEGLPMVILEAMSLGKPVVASDVGGIKEIVENGVNGYVVQNVVSEFAGKIKKILENDALYCNMSQNSLRIFNEKLTIDKMVNDYWKTYQKIGKRL